LTTSDAVYPIQFFYDHEVDQWGYEVEELNVLGTGCPSKEAAARFAQEAIEFALEEEPPLANG
jgi:isocitrate dehydrogenase